MSEKMFCVRCALDTALGKRPLAAGIPNLVAGVCPECGGSNGMARDAECPSPFTCPLSADEPLSVSAGG